MQAGLELRRAGLAGRIHSTGCRYCWCSADVSHHATETVIHRTQQHGGHTSRQARFDQQSPTATKTLTDQKVHTLHRSEITVHGRRDKMDKCNEA